MTEKKLMTFPCGYCSFHWIWWKEFLWSYTFMEFWAALQAPKAAVVQGRLRVWKLRCADGQLAGNAQHKGYGARWLMLGRAGEISLIELAGIIYGHFRTGTRAPSWLLLWAVLSYVHTLAQKRKSHSPWFAKSPQYHQSKSFLTITILFGDTLLQL